MHLLTQTRVTNLFVETLKLSEPAARAERAERLVTAISTVGPVITHQAVRYAPIV